METFWVRDPADARRTRPARPRRPASPASPASLALTRLPGRAAHPGSARPAPAAAGGVRRLDVHMVLAGGRGVRESHLRLAQLHLFGCELRRALRGLHPADRALPAAARRLAPAAAAGPLGSSGPRRAGACARAPAPGSARLSSAALPPPGSQPPALGHSGCAGHSWPGDGPSWAVWRDRTLVLLCLPTHREGRWLLSSGASGPGAFCCFRETLCLNWAWWHTPLISRRLRGQRPVDICGFKASQGYRVRRCF